MTTALIERIFLKFHSSDEESGVEKSKPSPQGYLEKARDPHDSMSGVPKASAGNLYDFIVEATELLEQEGLTRMEDFEIRVCRSSSVVIIDLDTVVPTSFEVGNLLDKLLGVDGVSTAIAESLESALGEYPVSIAEGSDPFEVYTIYHDFVNEVRAEIKKSVKEVVGQVLNMPAIDRARSTKCD